MLGSLHTRIKVSTNDLAERLGISQQTVSRHLIELEKQGYLERQLSYQGTYLQITEKGRKELERIYMQLKGVLEKKLRIITLDGDVINGLGEGSYYMKRKGYRNQFLKELGFDPYPGTLNLRLNPSNIEIKKELETYPGIIIKGFKTGNRTFGNVKCFPATINNTVEGAVALIHRTHHDDSILELIAPIHLRRSLNLEKGSPVQVIIKL
jgi:riboflavin kinase